MYKPSQVSPLKPSAHSHENVLPLFVQIPLFLQGRKSHGFGTGTTKQNYLVRAKIVCLFKACINYKKKHGKFLIQQHF